MVQIKRKEPSFIFFSYDSFAMFIATLDKLDFQYLENSKHLINNMTQ